MALREKGRLVVPRKCTPLTPEQREARAVERALVKLGQQEYDRVKLLLLSLGGEAQRNKTLVDGVIMGLLQRNLSNLEIRSFHKFGNSRINRIRRLLKNPDLLLRKRPRPVHAVTTSDRENLRAHLATYETEDGFPCAHRRPRKFFVRQGVTWLGVWKEYRKSMQDKDPPQRVLSLVRWREYVRAIFPGLHLSRPKSDLCDRCVRIEIELGSPDITPERKQYLLEEKEVHLEAAIAQRKI